MSVTAARLREILLTEYGISNEKEFNEAVKNSPGINIGLFTTPLKRKEKEHEKKAI